MLEKFKSLNRDNLHFVMLAAFLVFGLACGPVGHDLKPGDPGLLYWWPTPFTQIWLGLGVTLVLLLIVGRSQVLAGKVPLFHLWISLAMALAVAIALWSVTLCHVGVFADRIERQTLTMKGLQHVVYPFDTISGVQFDCVIANERGALHSKTPYVLKFQFDETLNLSDGRNDSRDHGRWIQAIAYVDKFVMDRHIPKSNQRSRDGTNVDIGDCLTQLSKERTPEETAIITQAFQGNIFISRKKS